MSEEKHLVVEDFEDKLDSIFTLDADLGDEPEFELKLVECTRKPTQEFRGRFREPFSLLFEGPRDRILHQATYGLKHNNLEETAIIFLVPVSQSETATQYQAVFN